MPFQYTPYTSPYTSAIAELIGQRGNIAAQQAQNRSALVGNITNAVTKSLGDILQYKMDAPKREMEALQLANAKQSAADAAENRSAATLYGNLLSSNYAQGYERQGPSATSATGTLPTYGDMTTKIGDVTVIDKDKVLQAMAQAGHGAWALDHADKIDALNASKIELNNAKNTVLQRAALTYATLPEPLKLQGAQTILDTLHGSGVLPKEQEALFVSQLQTGDTSGIDAAVRQYLPPPTVMKIGQGENVVAVSPAGTASTVYQGQAKPLTTAEQQAAIRTARAAVDNGTATQEQKDLVRGEDLRIRAEQRTTLTDQDDYLKQYAKNMGKSVEDLTTTEYEQGLQRFRNSTRFAPTPPVNTADTVRRTQALAYAEQQKDRYIRKSYDDATAALAKNKDLEETLSDPSRIGDRLARLDLLRTAVGRVTNAEINAIINAGSTIDNVRTNIEASINGKKDISPKVREALLSIVRRRIRDAQASVDWMNKTMDDIDAASDIESVQGIMKTYRRGPQKSATTTVEID